MQDPDDADKRNGKKMKSGNWLIITPALTAVFALLFGNNIVFRFFNFCVGIYCVKFAALLFIWYQKPKTREVLEKAARAEPPNVQIINTQDVCLAVIGAPRQDGFERIPLTREEWRSLRCALLDAEKLEYVYYLGGTRGEKQFALSPNWIFEIIGPALVWGKKKRP